LRRELLELYKSGNRVHRKRAFCPRERNGTPIKKKKKGKIKRERKKGKSALEAVQKYGYIVLFFSGLKLG
jgi:hypothetical protein